MKMFLLHQIWKHNKNQYQEVGTYHGAKKIIRKDLVYDNFKNRYEEDDVYILELSKEKNANAEA